MTAEPNGRGDSYRSAFTPECRRGDWSVSVQGLGRRLHKDATVGKDPLLGDDFIAVADGSGAVVARYQRSSVLAMAIEPPDEPQQQR